jgi:hypothetical protein
MRHISNRICGKESSFICSSWLEIRKPNFNSGLEFTPELVDLRLCVVHGTQGHRWRLFIRPESVLQKRVLVYGPIWDISFYLSK